MCTAMAAGGTSQRLNPGLATVASRERKLIVKKNAVLVLSLSGNQAISNQERHFYSRKEE
jgi:hypothetical protein